MANLAELWAYPLFDSDGQCIGFAVSYDCLSSSNSTRLFIFDLDAFLEL